ncbi:unnamed protein product [Prunus armeniaca]|uniref:Uncharacterized protein n=1 Tax=Prunus armeniaca TaxID=36596 RepID=A0A6J5XP71_PRUAR|nr:unnamed protein product [Prunus armeniaca]
MAGVSAQLGGMGHFSHGVKVSIRSFSSGHIDVMIEGVAQTCFRFTSFYGNPKLASRKHSWELLCHLADGYSGPWVVGGYFNEVLELNEYLGRRYRPASQMRDFCVALEDCGLTSMKYKGYKFTWTNNRNGDDRVQLRFDRGVANATFFQAFPGAIVHHVNSLIRWGGLEDLCLKKCGLKLMGERRQLFKLGERDKIQGQLDGFKKKPQTDDVVQCQRRLASELDILLAKEEMIWQQRSQVSWLKYGDRNTKLFHAQAKQRGRRNFMQGILNEHNVWNTSNEGVGSIFCEYFKKLFTTSGENDFSIVLAAVQPKVTSEHNERLSQPFTRVELEDVL